MPTRRTDAVWAISGGRSRPCIPPAHRKPLGPGDPPRGAADAPGNFPLDAGEFPHGVGVGGGAEGHTQVMLEIEQDGV